MKLRHRLWLPAAATAMVTLASGLLMLRAERQRETLEAAYRSAEAQDESLGRLRLLVDANVTRTVAGVFSPGSDLTRKLAPEIERTTGELAALAQQFSQTPSGSSAAVMAALAELTRQLVAARRMKDEGDVGGARELIDAQVKAAGTAFNSRLAGMLGELRSTRDVLHQQVEEGRRTQQATLLLVLAALLGVTAASTVYLSRSVCRPIERMRVFANRVADGDLQLAPGTAPPDELGEVILALDQMRLALAGTVSRVRECADAVNLASAEIQAANLDLSQRTEAASAFLESLRALSVSVLDQTSLATESAMQLLRRCDMATQSNTTAVRSVAEMIDIMRTVDQNARSVAESVQTVESIAFQTGILALNASIEAAHAGQSGKGFAVVAENVQLLARRSSTAAREIQVLIAANLGSTDAGQKRVADSNGAMARVSEAFNDLATTIRGISGTVEAQRRSIQEMATDLGRLDSMTMQNAAMSEQGAAAASHLHQQAGALVEAMARFRIPEGLHSGDGPEPDHPPPSELAMDRPSPKTGIHTYAQPVSAD